MVRLTVELIDETQQFINSIQLRELNLRGYKIPIIENMGITKDQFDLIDLSDNDIKKLDNFPVMKRLSALYLHNNRVQYIAPDVAEKLPALKTLALTSNNLLELGDIDPLANCKHLEYITFIGNPMTHKSNYRLYAIYKIPSLRVIDFKRVRLAERKAAKKMFKGKEGKKARDTIQRSAHIGLDKENEEAVRSNAGDKLTADDRAKIQEAINHASSLAEVEHLQAILASGKVPEKGWNRQLDLAAQGYGGNAHLQQNRNGNGDFQPEQEEDMES
ncbi:hypothetical protein WR25_09030 [Diploscapter pachys]|uniref:Probable U2 small nuclear ribonucleoprotein A' n=1 Tax=Diploscapter pachys TaxID=2018661 RepID=A0A2A2M1A1_9BILA|nr:hypothetical protein WR25_09030 [Diploscapter pachys]